MNVLVAYATRHGSTAGIADRIADVLRAAGLPAEAHPVGEVRDLAPYDAVVLGGAAYMFHWLKDATAAGDFRDWPAIDAWAHAIAAELDAGGEARP